MGEVVTCVRQGDGAVECTKCGKVAVGVPFEYPKMWDETDVKPYVSSGRLRRKLSKLVKVLNGQGGRKRQRRKQVYLAQGNHSAFSHTDVLAHAVDFALPQGTAILAGREGLVVDLVDGFKHGGMKEKFRSKANFVAVRHADGTYGRYFHLQYKSVPVTKGDYVKQGDLIGRCGSTGYSQGAHLHFDVVDCYMKETSVLELLLDGDNGGSTSQKIESAYATFSAQQSVSAPLQAACKLDQATETEEGMQSMRGKIVLSKRGGETFYEKAFAAQSNGALGLIIYDTDPSLKGNLHLAGGMKDGFEPITIPVLMVSYQSGMLLKAAKPTCHARISRSPYLELRLRNPIENTPFCKPVTQPILFQREVLDQL